MIATPANLLIMDEPTNHLDMMSQEVIQEAMRSYDGSIIVVSHNRYFLDQFVNKVLEIKAGGHTLFEGNISGYLERTAALGLTTGNPAPGAPPAAAAGWKGAARLGGREARQAQARLRQEKSRLLSPLRKKNAETEREISSLEGRKAELEQSLADTDLYKDKDAFSRLNREYLEVKACLDMQYQRWEEVQSEIDEIEASFAGQG